MKFPFAVYNFEESYALLIATNQTYNLKYKSQTKTILFLEYSLLHFKGLFAALCYQKHLLPVYTLHIQTIANVFK